MNWRNIKSVISDFDGTEMMKRAAGVAAERGLEWLHVDYVPQLDAFYRGCGYRRSEAGLLNLRNYAV
jgi:hypothetical protein